MKLILKLSKPIHGYWSGGAKDTFDFGVEGSPTTDSKGRFVRVGSLAANHWFHVAVGRTEKQTLANARRRLGAAVRRQGLEYHFSYREDKYE